MRNGIAPIRRVEEQHAGLAVVMRLFDDLIEQLTRFHFLVRVDRDPRGFGLLERAAKSLLLHLFQVGEAQFPFFVVLHRAHKRIRDADRNIEISNMILVDLTGNEIFHIGMIHAQHSHIGAAPCSALRDLAKGVIVYAQESNGTRRLTRRSLHHRSLRT